MPDDPSRRSPDAASVVSRWWEAPPPAVRPDPPLPQVSGSQAVAWDAAMPPRVPPPPPPAWSPVPPAQPTATPAAAADAARIQRLEQELAAARDEATALHEMLEDLPEIFERKFRQRLHGVLEQQQLLLADNRLLREQLYALQPAAEAETRPERLLLPALPSQMPQSRSPEALRRVLHGVRRLGRRLRPGRLISQAGPEAGTGSAELSDRDDGLPRAA